MPETLWEVEIRPAAGHVDRAAQALLADAADLGLKDSCPTASTARGYLVQGELSAEEMRRAAETLLADTVVESVRTAPVGDARWSQSPPGQPLVCYVLLKPGVTDPVAHSAQTAMRDLGYAIGAARTFRKYWLPQMSAQEQKLLCGKILANDSIELASFGPLQMKSLQLGSPYQFQKVEVALLEADDAELAQISRRGCLSLSIEEMRAVRDHFRQQGRNPTDAELETIAQTWSEHCSHKTLAGRIRYRDEHGERLFANMLKETIFAATQTVRKQEPDWCVSVFKDNAGVVLFDERFHVAFKVETHNRPSALEPYGGANTGIGGVIRDILGVGLGARPVCNTDVFCFAPPDTPSQLLPPGVLHPRRVMKGVVAGVRDYGNRMGIPTVNGAVYFDDRYIGNPLVFCGTVGLLPVDRAVKQPQAGDWIVALGGRTGRDGIHGATFSSAELTSESESLSGGAVQIGNAITEKMVLDVLLAARDEGLYHAVTDCGAGGFSSAVGEMASEIGAEVWLEKAPLKYQGLSYTEIWISEAQERMVLAVPPKSWDRLAELCRSEGVEAVIIGRFEPTGRLVLKYEGRLVADLDMQFLHDGRPDVVREAVYSPRPPSAPSTGKPPAADRTPLLLSLLGSLNIASKESIIRQYDHEVQGGAVVRPLVGKSNDGPSDAAVIRPLLDSRRALVVACGMNPRLGDLDPYLMAASAIDEAVRNCVAVGADPRRVALLDNFCWGRTDRPETLGALVRAALGCHDTAIALGLPFISGKDSLHNEFSYSDANGQPKTIAIPHSLLISALGQVEDVGRCVTMDLKAAGNLLYQVGETRSELGGSHWEMITGAGGGAAPPVFPAEARSTFDSLHRAIQAGLVRACHDLSEGGLAVAAAEMAFAGDLGARIYLSECPFVAAIDGPDDPTDILLFAESNSRFLCEVPADRRRQFEEALGDAPHACIGEVSEQKNLEIFGLPLGALIHAAASSAPKVVSAPIDQLKAAWQAPLRW